MSVGVGSGRASRLTCSGDPPHGRDAAADLPAGVVAEHGAVVEEGHVRRLDGPRVVPEGVEQVLVSTTLAVGDHVEQERRQQLRGERAAAREVPRIATEAKRGWPAVERLLDTRSKTVLQSYSL